MIKFSKMHGLGNDYVYIDAINQKITNESELAKFVSNRNFGIGSDGLILICKSETADFKMKMYNSDGSQAEMCGNGIRCVGKFVYDKGLTNKTNITIETLAGIKKLELNINNNFVDTVKVDMGEPIFNPKDIPVISLEEPVQNLLLNAIDKTFAFTCVSMGNPHAITVVEDVMNFEVEKYGKILEIDKSFPKRANIEFVEIKDRSNIEMRVWERGAGETLACGTGASAVTVACCLNNLTNNEVNVHLLGGILKINWNQSDNHVYMTGPATLVFDGEINDLEFIEQQYKNALDKVNNRKR